MPESRLMSGDLANLIVFRRELSEGSSPEMDMKVMATLLHGQLVHGDLSTLNSR
jgi:serine/threonine-protein kinase RIO1